MIKTNRQSSKQLLRKIAQEKRAQWAKIQKHDVLNVSCIAIYKIFSSQSFCKLEYANGILKRYLIFCRYNRHMNTIVKYISMTTRKEVFN